MSTESANESVAPALIAALDLFRAPDRLVLAQSSPLPEGVVVLLRVAGGDQALVDALAAEHALSAEQIHEACVFFVQSVLFHQDSDHFRVLGATRDDDAALLKSHYRWLQKWLHPDRDPDGWSSVYSHRVNMAWDVLKRPERREEYLQSLAPERRMPGAGTALAISPVIIPVDRAPRIRWSAKWVRRLPTIVAALAVLLALGLWSAHRAGQHMLAEGQRRPAPALADVASSPPARLNAGSEEFDSSPESLPVVAQADAAPPVSNPSLPEDGVTVSSSVATPTPRFSAAVASEPGTEPASLSVPGIEARRPESSASQAASGPMAAVESAPAAPGPAPPEAAPAMAAAVAPTASGVRAEPSSAGPNGRATPTTAPTAVATAPRTPDPRSDSGTPAPSVAASSPPAGPAAAAARPQMPAVSVVAPPQSAPERPAPIEARVVSPAPVVATVAVPEPAPVVPVLAAPVVPPASVPPPGPSPEQVAEGQRLIRSFSTAYRNGELQELVVMFRPNARTPAGNLLDLHSRYQTVFAQSASRSLEFISVDWRETERGIEGVGRFEWAMRPRGGGRVRSTGGAFRIVIEFENGRALIARLEQQDVG